MKLFHVTTIVHVFDGHKDVPFDWFYNSRRPEPQRPYAELIENYGQASDRGWVEDCIDEMFSEDEANQLKAYLDANKVGHVTTIKPAELPIPNNCMPCIAVPLGGGQDHWTGLRGQLPFNVEAYFDLRHCELVR
jgi:hypothetical protein